MIASRHCRKEVGPIFLKRFSVFQNAIFPDVCVCMNPWKGQEMYEHMGDDKLTCPNGWCYVDCNSDCTDRALAKGKGRCWSKVACDMKIPLRNQEKN